MSKRESITRYSLIIKKLKRKPSTFEEISNYLQLQSELEEYNFNISKRTFQRDIIDIRQLYKIDIQFNRTEQHYFINDDEHPEINERILEAFDTYEALNMSDRLSNAIYFEKRKPRGTENLYGILHAIRKQVRLRFDYQSFHEDGGSQRLVDPYALKEFKNRWYLVASDCKDNRIKTFGLDRLANMEITRQCFEHNGFDVNSYYRNCFGIISPNADKPSTIQLWFETQQGKFIKSLPLHETQRVIKDDENGLLVELSLFITYDLIMELLSYGGNLKVVKPKELIKQIKSAHEQGFLIYEEDGG